MERFNDKLDKIAEDVTEIRVIISKNSVILEKNIEDIAYHIKRTDLLEKKIEHVEFPLKVVKWVLGVVAALGAAITGVYQLLQILGYVK